MELTVRRACSLAAASVRHLHQGRVGIVGAPFCKGQKRVGVEEAPRLLREAGLVSRLEEIGCSVLDYGDLEFEEGPQGEEGGPAGAVGRASQQLAQAVRRALRDGRVCVTLGGDHSLAMGSVSGHARERPDVCVLWVDAHADVNTPLTSPTGNLHGQPVAFLLRELRDKVPALPGLSWLSPCLLARDIAYIGLRDVDPAESFILKSYGMRHFSMRDVDQLGIQKVVEMALDHLMPRCRRPLHLSYDIDAFDPSVAPATGTPVRGGLTHREGMFIAEEVHASGSLSALDLVEVNPRMGRATDGRDAAATVSLGVEVVLSCLGRARAGAHAPTYALPVPAETGPRSQEEKHGHQAHA